MTISIQAPSNEAPATAPEGMASTGTPITPGAPAPAEASTPAAPANPADRPAWLPEGFDSPEALAKAYTDLSAKPAAPAAPGGSVSADQMSSIVGNAGLEMGEFVAEFGKDGKLSEASYAKLEKANLSRGFVDAFIEGQQAVQTNFVQSVYQEVGGQSEFAKVQSWARSNLSPAEAKAFNSVMENGDLETSRLAVRGLQARYSAANGTEPSLIGGSGAGAGMSGTFASTAQVTAAMSDPRYRSDPAYRDEVIRKLGTSNVF